MAGSERMASVDAAWLRMDMPDNPMMVTGLFVLAEPVDLARLRAVLAERLVGRYPRFRQRIVPPRLPLGRPRWEDDPDFDLDHHLPVRFLAAPQDPGVLRGVLAELASRNLPLDRPPWTFTILADGQGARAIVARLSHAIADGVALARVVLSLTDDTASGDAAAHPVTAPTDPPPAPAGSRRQEGALARALTVAWRGLTQLGEDPRRAATAARLMVSGLLTLPRLAALPRAPSTGLRRPLSGRKRLAWSDPVPLADVKALGRASGATINDVLMNAMAGALGRVLAAAGQRVDQVRATVPVDLRDPDAPVGLGNRFGIVFLELPVGVADEGRRLERLTRRMGAIKCSPEAVVTFGALTVLGALPAPLQRAVIRLLGSKATLVLTNVPGPRHPVYLAGTQVRELQYWVPQSGGVGLGVSILSFDGRVTVGVAADTGLDLDPEHLVAAFRTELDAMLARHADGLRDPLATPA